MNMADRIQYLRKTKGLSQEELADKIGVSRQAVSKWESEQSTPDIEKIIIMSELFEVTTDYILRGIEPVDMTNKKTIYSLYLGFAVVFGTIAGIWSFTANRFHVYECFFIMVAGAAIGCAIALIIQTYVPLRAGRCESLPHMKYRTEGDISQLLLNPASAYSRSDGGRSCLHKPQFVQKSIWRCRKIQVSIPKEYLPF